MAPKIPLAVKKNIRDEFTNKIEELQEKLSRDSCLGIEWILDINPAVIFENSTEGSYGASSTGSCVYSYVSDAAWRLESFRSKYGAEAIDDLNKICHEHKLTLGMDEDKSFRYNGCMVENGCLKILIAEGKVGTNIADCLEGDKLMDALNKVPVLGDNDSTLSFKAKTSIRNEYDGANNVEACLSQARETLAYDKLEFDPNWEANVAKLQGGLKAGKSVKKDWEDRIGFYTLAYFKGFVWQLNSQNFKDPDYQEAFKDAIDSAKVVVRIVDKLDQGSYNEIVIEDGILYIDTLAEKWGVNVDYACAELQNKL